VRPRSILKHYLPLAAAFLLFVGGVALFTASHQDRPASPPSAPSLEVTLPAQAPSPLAGKLEQERAAAATQVQALSAEIARLGRALADEKARAAVETAERAAEAELARSSLQRKVDALAGIVDKRDEEIAALRANAAGELKTAQDMQKRIDDLNVIVGDLQQSRNKALDAKAEAENRLEIAMNAAAAASAAPVAGAPPTAPSAARQSGIVAIQQAARQARLLRRGTALKATITDPDARRILDRLEVLLTRLDLLDPRNGFEVDGFREALRQADVAGRVAEVLQVNLDPAARAWMIETRTLLEEVQHVA
jgi:Skp family chaperone for outer membrane proteins